MPSPTRILLLHDSSESLSKIRTLFGHQRPMEIDSRHKIANAIDILKEGKADVVLLDLDISTDQLLLYVRRLHVQCPNVPILVLANSQDELVARQALREGAQDYVIKERVDGRILWRIIDYSIERKSLEAALRESERKYYNFIQDAPDPIVYMNSKGILETFNHAAEQLSGYKAKEIIGKHFSQMEMIPKESLMKAVREFANLSSGKESKAQEYEILDKDKKALLIEAKPRLLNKGKKILGVQIIFRDLTQHKSLEAQLQQMQKMGGVGRLAGGIAHDFNNLLCVMNGYCDFIIKDMPKEDERHGMIREVKKAAERAISMTRQLLNFSRRQAGDLKVVNFNNLIMNMDNMIRRLIGEDIEFVTLPGIDLESVYVDPVQVEQVLVNLVVNARDAMPAGGKIVVETRNVFISEKEAPSEKVPAGKYVMVSVTDTGEGMDEETLSKIFDPFFTTKSEEKGTGIGLSMSYELVTKSGGNITVVSKKGHGTTFRLFFPRVQAEADVDLGFDIKEGEMPSGTETVLLVENEDSVRGLVRHILDIQGYRVLEAANGVEALHVAERFDPNEIDILITDLVMPEMGGKEVSEQLLRMCPDLKVLFMSGYYEDTIFLRGLLNTGDTLLRKPFTREDLSQVVRKVLDNK